MSDTVLGSKCSLCNGTGRVYHYEADYYGRTRIEIVPAPNFAPSDWNLLAATQESLREHMALLKAAEAKVASAQRIIDEWDKRLHLLSELGDLDCAKEVVIEAFRAALQEPEHE